MIDDALRRFRAYLPDDRAGTDAARSLARRVMDQAQARPVPRHTRRRGVAVAAVSGLAAVAALAVVAVKVDRGSPATTPIVIGTPRVDWGMRALIAVTPDPGVSVEDATQRVKELIVDRLTQLDVQGAKVGSTKQPGQLSLTVPGAEDPSQVAWIMQISHLRVLRTDARVITGRTLAELRRGLRAPAHGAQVKYLVEVERRRAPSPSDIRLVDTIDEARRLARRLPAESSFVTVDATSALVLSEPDRYSLLPSASTIPSDRLDVTTTASGLVVSYPRSAGGPGRVYVASSQGGIGAGIDRQWVAAGPLRPIRSSDDPSRVRVVVPRRIAQRLLLDTGPSSTTRDHRLLIGDVTVTSLAHYGSPPIEGIPDQSAARTLSGFVNGGTPANTAWRRVLTTANNGVSVRLFTTSKAGPKSLAAAVFTVSRGRRTLSTGSLGMSGTSQTPCPVGMGAPAMNPCLPFPPIPSQPGVIAGGRRQPEVARIEARTASGHRFSATIEGSWFVVVTDERLPVSDFQSSVRLTAFAADGTVLRQTGS